MAITKPRTRPWHQVLLSSGVGHLPALSHLWCPPVNGYPDSIPRAVSCAWARPFLVLLARSSPFPGHSTQEEAQRFDTQRREEVATAAQPLHAQRCPGLLNGSGFWISPWKRGPAARLTSFTSLGGPDHMPLAAGSGHRLHTGPAEAGRERTAGSEPECAAAGLQLCCRASMWLPQVEGRQEVGLEPV